jgi:hypothetical protein
VSSRRAATKQIVNATKPFWRFRANVPKRFICIDCPNDAPGTGAQGRKNNRGRSCSSQPS